MEQVQIGSIAIDVIRKDIKNIHLSVYPPEGRVKISAPNRMELDTIRVYALSKLSWIKKQQAKFSSQEREAPREYIDRESHYYRGKRYLLRVLETKAPPKVVLRHDTLDLHVRPGTDSDKRKRILGDWYRAQLKHELPALISKWEQLLSVKITAHGVRRMKTNWGTCNPVTGRILLNLELAKKPPGCLEYIVVHELLHMLERKHNDRFVALMSEHLPQWRYYQDLLSRLPMKDEVWDY